MPTQTPLKKPPHANPTTATKTTSYSRVVTSEIWQAEMAIIDVFPVPD